METKFRAWDRPTKKMIYAEEFWIGKTGWSAVNRENGIAFTETDHLNGELMQYTGLHDKNGNEYYTGHLVKEDSLNCKVGVIVLKNGCYMLWFDDNTEYLLYHYQESGEIIGTIYENPELLSAKTEA